MVYAKIVDGRVRNLLELHRSQSHEYPDCVETRGLPVSIGDVYIDGKFFHNGVRVKSGIQAIGDRTVMISAAALSTVQERCRQDNTVPDSNIGLYIMGTQEWKPGQPYNRFDLVQYNGSVAWVKQAHTSQDNWKPFAIGTESLYGARPVPDENGIYPYVYNMSVKCGMKVRDDGALYECIQDADDLLFKPAQVPALFKIVCNEDPES